MIVPVRHREDALLVGVLAPQGCELALSAQAEVPVLGPAVRCRGPLKERAEVWVAEACATADEHEGASSAQRRQHGPGMRVADDFVVGAEYMLA